VEAAVSAITVDTRGFTLDLHSIDVVGLGTLLLAFATFWLAWKEDTVVGEGGREGSSRCPATVWRVAPAADPLFCGDL
jgi:hypothetical protein